jgi:hypothetical protein
VTAPDELETTLLEWAREFSEPTIRQSEDRTVTIEWGVRGWSNCTKVADELIDEWVADKNRIVALEADVARLTAERDARPTLDEIMPMVHERDRCEVVIGHLLGDDNPDRWSGGFIHWLEAVEDHLGIEPHKPAWQERDEFAAADPLHTHNTPEPTDGPV